MKPAPFKYVVAQSIDHALALLEQHGADAKLIAGGQSLVPMMNFRLARPEWLIDINRVGDLAGISFERGVLRIGSMTRYCELHASALVGANVPLLHDVLPHIAHAAIRNRGTIGGSVCHADPAAEMPVALLALDAEFEIRGPHGTRRVAADAFFVGQMTTAVEPDEILVAIHIPAQRATDSFNFTEFARRRGDFALTSVVSVLRFSADRISDHVRITIGSLAERAMRAREAERLLTGQVPRTALFEQAAHAAAIEVQVGSDLHASADYRRDLIRTHVLLGLSECNQRRQQARADVGAPH